MIGYIYGIRFIVHQKLNEVDEFSRKNIVTYIIRVIM